MGQTVVLQDDFSGGMYRDAPRHRLPAGKLWNSMDFIPSLDGSLRKRGGWSYASPDLSTVTAGSSQSRWVHSVVLNGTEFLLATDEDGNPFSITSSSAATDLGTVPASSKISSALGYAMFTVVGSTPRKYNGTTLSDISGSPPQASMGSVFGSYAVLANTTSNSNRVFFSAAGNIDSWDTTNSYVDVPSTVYGLASLPGALLIFQSSRVDAIVGTTPPNSTSTGDFSLKTIWEGPGITFPGQLATGTEGVAWRTHSGVYLTDGAAVTDVTKLCGVKELWPSVASASANDPIGFFKGYLIAGGDDRCFVFDLQRRSAFRFDLGVGCWNFSTSPTGDEMYGSITSLPRVMSLSSIWSPSSSNTQDANGTDIQPFMETPFYELGAFTKKRFKNLYLTYDLRAVADSPSLLLQRVTSPEATSYTTIGSAFAETSALTRTRRAVRRGERGLGLKLIQTNDAADDLYVYGIEAEVYGEEPFK